MLKLLMKFKQSDFQTHELIVDYKINFNKKPSLQYWFSETIFRSITRVADVVELVAAILQEQTVIFYG